MINSFESSLFDPCELEDIPTCFDGVIQLAD